MRPRRLISKQFRYLIVTQIFAVLITACQPQPNAGEPPTAGTTNPPVEVMTQVFPPMNPTATPVCTSLPSDMTLSVTPTSPTSAQIEMTGLSPGEGIILIYYAEIPGQSSNRIEDMPVQTADTNGHFVYTAQGLSPLSGSTKNRWEIQIIHSRGATCTEVTLP